jgi:hypothetical protein
MADSDKRLRELAIFLDSSEGFSILFRSTSRISASRIVAYCEMMARMPVAAATPIVRYLLELRALNREILGKLGNPLESELK